jgi:hypothetical protein
MLNGIYDCDNVVISLSEMFVFFHLKISAPEFTPSF